NALWRHAHARGTACYRLTGRQLARACGYEELAENRRWHSSLDSYRRVLAEAGLVDISGRDELSDGRTCVVTLREPARKDGAIAYKFDKKLSCRAVRRRETRSQREDRRVRPWCPKGGRGRATQRWDFLFGSISRYSGLGPPYGGSKPARDVRGREAGPPDGGLVDAPICPQGPAPPPQGQGPPSAGQGPAPAVAAFEAAPPSLDRGSQLERLRTAAGREGPEALSQAARAGGDPVAIAIVAWELWFDGRPALSRKRRLQLERSCLTIDRIRGETGAGALHLLGFMAEVRGDLGLWAAMHPHMPPPATLAWFVTRLRRDARAWRRQWRARRAQTEPGSYPGAQCG